MKKFELRSFSTDTDLAETVADQLWALLGAPSPAAGVKTVALSGGRISKKLFTALLARVRSRPQSLAHVHFFWADERCVPLEDPENSSAVAQSLFFTPAGIPRAQIHRIRGELDPAEAVRLAEQELRTLLPSPAVLPALDLVLLGMGEDGHVASLFPDRLDAPEPTGAIYLPVVAAKPPPRRITLTYQALLAAREVWVLASGPGKETALAASLGPDVCTPLGRVLGGRRTTQILTDIPQVSGSFSAHAGA